ncbi:DUF2854 domain-containing protein [Candidatus Synechococcus spongiarum]|uniref:Cyanobacterial protein slr0575 n=1 Tax=Candidatus Synechococcus spongiarum TaxID=431041 RepID=A0A171DHK1_9SYNE|nr:DUF2854 domain-containing protein [Candidatus Synechococcus spongiarum]SAY39289.1 Cyanobacterial protein slr0575 [Candidatus Synechococcus spongiarum]
MGSLLSPGSWITVSGTSLAVFGLVAYATDHPTLNLVGLFSGIPVLLGGLALKSSELPPVPWLQPPDAQSRTLRQTVATEVQRRLVKDVRRWRYGQKAHLESSLEILKLWHRDKPPQLTGLRENDVQGHYQLTMRFRLGSEEESQAWFDRRDRLARFFGPGLEAAVVVVDSHCIEVQLLSC